MYLSRHRDIKKLSGAMPANTKSFTFLLAQHLSRIRHTNGSFCFSDGLDLPRSSFCAFCHQTLILSGTCLLEWWSSWTNPPAQAGPCAIIMPLGSRQHWCTKELSPPICRVTPPVHPTPRKQAGDCREWEQLAKAASSARLTAKELQKIMEIGSLTCYVFKMACNVTGCLQCL